MQPRGDVDALTVDVIAIDDDVAKIDPNAIADALLFGLIELAVCHRSLDGECAVQGLHDARKFDEGTIADQFEGPPAIGCDMRLEDGAAIEL